jgi:LacI family transcriptional regulator
LVLEQWNTQTFLSWVEHYRPDAIVTRLPEVHRTLKRAGYRVPDDIGVAYHSLDERSRYLSGMKKNSFQIGVMAVDLLVDMLHRNERGIPFRPYLLMVEGSWVEGNTLRKPSANAPRLRLPQSWMATNNPYDKDLDASPASPAWTAVKTAD